MVKEMKMGKKWYQSISNWIVIVACVILIPILRNFHIGQKVSLTLGERHLKKDGVPTMGGLIFIIPVLVSLIFLYLKGSINLNHNLIILVFVFLAYAGLGFIDDFLNVKYKIGI